jgi:hypothetical protein
MAFAGLSSGILEFLITAIPHSELRIPRLPAGPLNHF